MTHDEKYKVIQQHCYKQQNFAHKYRSRQLIILPYVQDLSENNDEDLHVMMWNMFQDIVLIKYILAVQNIFMVF